MVNLFQVRDCHGGVNAGRIKSGVAEKLLDDSDVGPVFVHVGRATVAQEMTRTGLFDSGRFDWFSKPVAQVALVPKAGDFRDTRC